MSTSESDEREKLVAYLRDKAVSFAQRAAAHHYAEVRDSFNKEAEKFASWATLVEESVRVSELTALVAKFHQGASAAADRRSNIRAAALADCARDLEMLIARARARPTEAKESDHE